MLLLHSSNRVTFDVNVQGTASTPTVRCVLGEHPGMIFPAVKLDDGRYEVLIELPPHIQPGAHSFKIEVMLNGRLFTPIENKITVVGKELSDVPASADTIATTTESPAKLDLPEVPSVVKAPTEPRGLDALESLAKTPVFKKPVKKPAAPMPKISMADIANEAVRIESPIEVIKPPVVENLRSIPLTLTKGEIIYK